MVTLSITQSVMGTAVTEALDRSFGKMVMVPGTAATFRKRLYTHVRHL